MLMSNISQLRDKQKKETELYRTVASYAKERMKKGKEIGEFVTRAFP